MGFDNRFVRELPGDTLRDPQPRQVTGAAYSRVDPTPVAAPRYLAWNQALADDLGLGAAQDWLAALAGNAIPPGAEPYAMAYAGHQFGNWAGQLGDGRAIALGEWRSPAGGWQELQLKGAGRTPYSRGADGRAVLRSSLREYVCSEAMHHLGVPTTRALSLVVSGDQVERDMFYDGRPQLEPGAIVCRVAPSFLRFGSFQLPASRNDLQLLRQLVSYSIRQHAPQHLADEGSDVLAWFGQICEDTAELMVHWLRVGFVHGVMNTDNMSIHGLTIDYGPYGWLEPYDPDWTPNTTDAHGRRYAFGRQPAIAQWNLARFAEALLPLVGQADGFNQGLARYAEVFHRRYGEVFASKLGLKSLQQDDPLLNDFLALLGQAETDYVLAFRLLSQLPLEASELDQDLAILAPAFYQGLPSAPAQRQHWSDWLQQWRARGARDGLPAARRRAQMDAHNPLYVPRNYLCQQAIDAATQGDGGELERLLTVLRQPYTAQPGAEAYAQRRPQWARNKPGCSALSCSS